jgi:beta-lactamase regulating signal transducer with metallopeptidase domain
MKIAVYISGITGILFLVIGIIGIMLDLSLNKVFLILGLVGLLLIFITLIIIDKYRYNKKINSIIDSYKGKEKRTIHSEKRDSKSKKKGMNNPQIRERKSGLTWGGGNIHGANASRGTRKSFLK